MLSILICILAGIGAGLSTGFAGLSAACFITPMLVAILRVNVYEAVGIALASDILASAVSACTYSRKGNIDLKNGRILLIFVLIFAIIGSALAFVVTSYSLGETALSYWSILGSLCMGVMLILRPQSSDKKEPSLVSQRRFLITIACAIYIGFICGFQGTGGGMMLLFTLTIVMRFDFKKAVGTSVFIMTFSALIGAVSHFLLYGFPAWPMLLTCVISTTVFARIGALIANRINAATLKRITGIMMTISGFSMLILKLLG